MTSSVERRCCHGSGGSLAAAQLIAMGASIESIAMGASTIVSIFSSLTMGGVVFRLDCRRDLIDFDSLLAARFVLWSGDLDADRRRDLLDLDADRRRVLDLGAGRRRDVLDLLDLGAGRRRRPAAVRDLFVARAAGFFGDALPNEKVGERLLMALVA